MSYEDRRDFLRDYYDPSWLILDIGCKDAYPWCGNLPLNVIGIDIDLWIYENFINAIGEALPFRDKSFDMTIIFEVLEHLPREIGKMIIREAIRVSKRLILVTIPDRDERNINPYHDDKWILKHPLFRRFGRYSRRITRHYWHTLWSLSDVVEFFKLFHLPFEIYEIENRYYKGWGIVLRVYHEDCPNNYRLSKI